MGTLIRGLPTMPPSKVAYRGVPLWSVIGRSMDGVHFSTGPRPADEFFEWMEECAVVVSDGWFATTARGDG